MVASRSKNSWAERQLLGVRRPGAALALMARHTSFTSSQLAGVVNNSQLDQSAAGPAHSKELIETLSTQYSVLSTQHFFI